METKPKDGGCNCGKPIKPNIKKGTNIKNNNKLRQKIYGK